MSNFWRRARTVLLSTGIVLLSGMAVGQTNEPGPKPLVDPDIFASVHEALSDAADRNLAAALAGQPWMKASQAGAADNGASTASGTVRAKQLRAAIDRVRRLQPTIEPILREEGVPAELSAVVLVESGGLPTALSPKGARGAWQLMPETARRYGLVVSTTRDERLDVSKSTHAAARYLRSLYRRFGDWQLAFAAYNAGEQAVARALGQKGQENFSTLEQVLPRETRDYVPAVLAAIDRLTNLDLGTPAHVIYASAEPGN